METKETIDNKYIILQKKGEGASSNVFLVKDLTSEEKYAAKVLKKSSNLFDTEIEILNSLKSINNPYIINIINNDTGFIVRKDKPIKKQQYLILEYAEKGELLNYITLTRKGFEEKYCKVIFRKILKGVQAFHNAGICHRDLKLENILLDKDFNPKICDFGFATYNTGKLTQSLGTENYAAPEILSNNQYDGYKADIFSLGVILFHLVTCKPCFPSARIKNDLYKLIAIKHYKLYWNKIGKVIKEVSKEFQNLFNKMVAYKPYERPTIDEILNHEWMKEIRDLNKEQYEELENEIRLEFMDRENIIKEEMEKINEKNQNFDNNGNKQEDEKG